MQFQQNTPLVPTLVALAVVLSLGACSKRVDDGATVGQKTDAAVSKVEQKTDVVAAKVEQKTDAAVAKVEQKTEQAVAGVKKGIESAEAVGSKVVDAAASKVKDAEITTRIKAELARDPTLSALKIDVDTNAGRVALNGPAPDTAARDRATTIAQGVSGVSGVDNKLEIRKN